MRKKKTELLRFFFQLNKVSRQEQAFEERKWKMRTRFILVQDLLGRKRVQDLREMIEKYLRLKSQ